MDCDCACAQPAAPDYSEIASANKEAAEKAYQAAADRLAFDKQQYDESKPYIDAARAKAMDMADQQTRIADENQQHANEVWDRWQQKYVPVEDKSIDDAMGYDSADRQEQVASTARNQVIASADDQRAAATRRLVSMGIRPDSGAYAASQAGMDVTTAATAANAANQARTDTIDKGIALRAGVANFGRGNKNDASAAYSTSVGAGNSATGQLVTGANAGLPAAGLVDAGYGGVQSAAAMAQQGALGYGGLLNTGYGIAMNGYNAGMAADAASSAGTGAMIGGLATAAGIAF